MKFLEFVKKDNAQTLVGTIRPSGRFSVCQTFPKKSKGFGHVKKEIARNDSLLSVSALDDNYQRILSEGINYVPDVLPGQPIIDSHVGLSIASNSRKRPKRGSKGINPQQRDKLCWAANCLERVYGQANLSFLTLTLPDLSGRDFDAIRESWAELVKSVIEEIKRELKRNGILTSVVGCTELQLERAQTSGRFYPHLHLVFRGRFHSRSGWAIQPPGFREIWRKCCSRILVDPVSTWGASENVQQVRKSVGGYLAKYVSKCASKHDPDSLGIWHPSDWIILGRRIRQLYEKLTYKSHELGLILMDVVKNWKSGMGYKQPIVISTPVFGNRMIGQWGWLKGEFTSFSFAQLHAA